MKMNLDVTELTAEEFNALVSRFVRQGMGIHLERRANRVLAVVDAMPEIAYVS